MSQEFIYSFWYEFPLDSDYHVIFYPGGHGPMFDLPNNDEIAALTKTAYESGAIVSAVCHGIVGQIFLTLLLYIYFFKYLSCYINIAHSFWWIRSCNVLGTS